MLAGRDSLEGVRIAAWADQGEQWLRREFAGKGLEFHTSWSVADKTISLSVYRTTESVRVSSYKKTYATLELLFEVTEPADIFISHTTLTKIIMVS